MHAKTFSVIIDCHRLSKTPVLVWGHRTDRVIEEMSQISREESQVVTKAGKQFQNKSKLRCHLQGHTTRTYLNLCGGWVESIAEHGHNVRSEVRLVGLEHQNVYVLQERHRRLCVKYSGQRVSEGKKGTCQSGRLITAYRHFTHTPESYNCLKPRRLRFIFVFP